jgi:transcriptional regulator with XRE-family HTH domain
MTLETTSSPPSVIVPAPGHAVKGRIYAAGLTMADLAAAAKVSRPTLSDHVRGRRRSRLVQLDVWMAFRRLTGSTVTLQEFWGPLFGRISA